MIHLRSREEWEGWDFWCEILERSGRPIPPERRCDMDYLLRASLDLPKQWGPMNGLPRNPKPFLRLIDETSIAADYDRIGTLTADRIPSIRTPVILVYAEGSAFLGTHDYLKAHLSNARSLLLPRTELGHFGPLEQPEIVAERILAAYADRELTAEAVAE
jgi:pimeloyl-ACP methyl ester carboxylesterase